MLSSVNSTLSDTFTQKENQSSVNLLPKKSSEDLQIKTKAVSEGKLRNYTKDGGSDTSGSVANAQTDFLNHLFGTEDDVKNEFVNNSNLKKHDVESKLANAKSQEPVLKLLGTGSNDSESDFSYDGQASIMSSFDSLASAVGAINDKISKEQLLAYLQTLKSGTSGAVASNEEIAFVKNLIAKFDTIADGGKYITSLSGIKDPQDPTTVTQEQLEFPIDIRV